MRESKQAVQGGQKQRGNRGEVHRLNSVPGSNMRAFLFVLLAFSVNAFPANETAFSNATRGVSLWGESIASVVSDSYCRPPTYTCCGSARFEIR